MFFVKVFLCGKKFSIISDFFKMFYYIGMVGKCGEFL